jgi:cytochrome P450
VRRKLDEPVVLYGHPIQAGRPIAVSLFSLARDPSVFPNPDQFDPNRWMMNDAPPSAAELATFGAGAHFCLGYHLAIMEGTLLTVGLAQAMLRAKLRPRPADGAAPRSVYLPLIHPSAATRIELVTSIQRKAAEPRLRATANEEN